MTVVDRLGAFVLRPVDARRLGYVRIAVGLAAFATAVECGETLRRVLAGTTVPMPYVGPVPRVAAGGVELLLAVWYAAALAFTVGWYTRLAGGVLLVAMGYVLFVDQQTYSNHLYLLVWVVALLILAGAGAAVSCDAWLRGGRRAAAAGPVFLLKSQLSVMYAFAALTKINATYLSGAVLAMNWRWEGPLALPAAARIPALLACAALASVAAEAFLAVALWLPKWRRAAVVVGVALHLGMFATIPLKDMLGVAIFAVASLALYALFFDEVPADCDVTPQRAAANPAAVSSAGR